MSESHPLRPALAGFGLVCLLAVAWFLIGSERAAEREGRTAVAPETAPAEPQLREPMGLADPGPGFEPGPEREKAAEAPPAPISASRAVELRQSAKPGIRLVDSELGSPLSYSLLTILDAGEQSDHRADLRGGVREALESAPDLLISEPDGTPIEEIEGAALGSRLVQGPGGLTLEVECGPSVLVGMGSDRGEVHEVELLSVGGFGSSRHPATFVGEWEAVSVHRLSVDDGASLGGVGRLVARARGSRRVAMAASGSEGIASGELHMLDLRPAEVLSYKVTRDLQRDERLFVGLTPGADTEVHAGIWGPEWIGALASPPSPYLLEGGTRVEFEALPTGSYQAELLTNYGISGSAMLETNEFENRLGDELSWRHSELGQPHSYRVPRTSPFHPLQVRFAKDGSLGGLAYAPDGHTSVVREPGTVMYAIPRLGGRGIRYERTDAGLTEEVWEAPYGAARNVGLEGDFDEGFPAYVLTGGTVGMTAGGSISSRTLKILEQLGYSEDGGGPRFAVRGLAVQRALRGQTVSEGATPPMLALRRLLVSGGGGHDSEVQILGGERTAELSRGFSSAVFVYQSTAGDPVPWPLSGGSWWPGADARPLSGIQITSAGPGSSTDLFGLATVRAEGDEPVAVRLPGLAPIEVGTGRSLRRAPGLLGVPPYDPK